MRAAKLCASPCPCMRACGSPATPPDGRATPAQAGAAGAHGSSSPGERRGCPPAERRLQWARGMQATSDSGEGSGRRRRRRRTWCGGCHPPCAASVQRCAWGCLLPACFSPALVDFSSSTRSGSSRDAPPRPGFRLANTSRSSLLALSANPISPCTLAATMLANASRAFAQRSRSALKAPGR